MSPFKPIHRHTSYLFPPSVDDWLPEQHLARFVVDVVEQPDLKEMERAYRGTGTEAFHPALLLSTLIYGYATGVFGSRKLERATYDSVAFRYVAANEHPDHDTLNTFRKRFLPQIEGLMVQVLLIAQAMKLVSLGHVALDGTKVKANASQHSALSYGHSEKLEQQLREEVARLLALAEAADNEAVPDGMSLPEEIARREDRLKAIVEAVEKLFYSRKIQSSHRRLVLSHRSAKDRRCRWLATSLTTSIRTSSSPYASTIRFCRVHSNMPYTRSWTSTSISRRLRSVTPTMNRAAWRTIRRCCSR